MVTEPQFVGTTFIQDTPYDNIYNSDAYAYFEDSGLEDEQGYCYYVQALHPSIQYGESFLENAMEQRICVVTDCITSIFYYDYDNDGLGDAGVPTQPQC